jgi:hypothetical protein
MELTRRDAVAALATLGATGLAGCSGSQDDEPDGDATERPSDDAGLDDGRLRTLAAAAEVLFPSDVSGHDAFVRRYVDGRTAGRDAYRTGLVEAVDDLNAAAREWESENFASLSRERRDRVLRELGVDTADSDPDGPLSERIRHYVVEELLYAFYASPVGGGLVGIENPVGYPGGTESYRRAEMEDDGRN